MYVYVTIKGMQIVQFTVSRIGVMYFQTIFHQRPGRRPSIISKSLKKFSTPASRCYTALSNARGIAKLACNELQWLCVP